MAEAKLAAELERVRAEAAEQRAAELARIEREAGGPSKPRSPRRVSPPRPRRARR